MTDHETNGTVSPEATRAESVFIPPTDIIETTAGVQMVLDMPGADPDSLDVTLENRVLRISARSASSAPDGYALLHAEYRDGSYERSFTVSEPIDTAAIEAVFKDGVLRLTLPKAAPSPAAKITVKAA
ncbi:MAG: heat-shock protein Hsp20 [Fulvimarina sp.]|nr:heat-shock protein Hsp20 [Fulvimarina sp.]